MTLPYGLVIRDFKGRTYRLSQHTLDNLVPVTGVERSQNRAISHFCCKSVENIKVSFNMILRPINFEFQIVNNYGYFKHGPYMV